MHTAIIILYVMISILLVGNFVKNVELHNIKNRLKTLETLNNDRI